VPPWSTRQITGQGALTLGGFIMNPDERAQNPLVGSHDVVFITLTKQLNKDGISPAFFTSLQQTPTYDF
jgi:hypothetical protein